MANLQRYGVPRPLSLSRDASLAALLALAAVLTWLVPRFPYWPRTPIVLFVAFVLISVGVLAASAMSLDGSSLRQGLIAPRLGVWFGLSFALTYGLATLSWLMDDIPSYNGRVEPSSFGPAVIVVVWSVVVISVTFRFAPTSLDRLAQGLDRWARGPRAGSSSLSRVWLLAGVAFVGLGLQVASGSFGYLSDPTASLSATSSISKVLQTMTMLGVLASFVSGRRLAARVAPSAIAVLLIIVGGQFILGLASGLKEAALTHLLAAGLGYFQRRGRISVVLVAVVIAIVALAVMPMVDNYRDMMNRMDRRFTPVEGLVLVLEGHVGLDSDEGDEFRYYSRLSRLGDVAIIINQTPSPISYEDPDRLLSAPLLGLVPRSVWRDKPVLDAGYQVNQIYYGAPADQYSSAAVTPYADLFRHGGAMPLVLGSAFYGLLLRMVDSRQLSTRSDELGPFLPILLIPIVAKHETTFVELIAGIPAILLVVFVSYRAARQYGTHNVDG